LEHVELEFGQRVSICVACASAVVERVVVVVVVVVVFAANHLLNVADFDLVQRHDAIHGQDVHVFPPVVCEFGI
jgi:hypothetical protein